MPKHDHHAAGDNREGAERAANEALLRQVHVLEEIAADPDATRAERLHALTLLVSLAGLSPVREARESHGPPHGGGKKHGKKHAPGKHAAKKHGKKAGKHAVGGGDKARLGDGTPARRELPAGSHRRLGPGER